MTQPVVEPSLRPDGQAESSLWLIRVVSQRDARNFIALLSAQVIVGAIGLASTRFMTPSDKGLFTAVYLWSLVGQTVVGLSLPNGVLYFGARESRYRASRSMILALSSASLVVGGLMTLFVAFHAPGHQLLEAIVAPLPMAMFLFEVATYSVLSRGGPFYSFRLLQAAAFAITGLPLLVATHSATVLTACLLFSYAVCVVALAWSRYSPFSIKSKSLRAAELLKWALRAHPGLTLSLLATRLDLLFVTLFLATTTAGIYAAASAIPNLLAFGGTALGLALARRATQHSPGGGMTFVWEWGGALLAANAVAALALIAARTPLMVDLFGSPYQPAGALLVPLALSLPFWSLAAYESQLLSAVGRPGHQTIGQGVAALILAAGSAYGVWHRAVDVVAWSNVVAYGTATIWQSTALLSRRHPSP